MPYTVEIPDFGSLSTEQRRAVQHAGSTRLKGGPGTGKSLVSLWRALNSSAGESVLVLTYTLSLEFYFNEMLKRAAEKGFKKNVKVQRSQKAFFNQYTMLAGRWDELVLDEAQDMTEEQLRLFKQKAGRISYGADYNQQLYPDKAASKDVLEEILTVTREFTLRRTYRSTRQILLAVRAFFPDRALSADALQLARPGQPVKFEFADRYDLFDKTKEVLRKTLDENPGNVAVLVPSEPKVDDMFDEVKQVLPSDTTYYRSGKDVDRIDEMGRVHVGTYKSSKGLEWDVVILPFWGGRDWFMDNTRVGENDHYVAMTRAKGQLCIISDDKYDETILKNG
jgi:superfamily I DNA/RNA helicase